MYQFGQLTSRRSPSLETSREERNSSLMATIFAPTFITQVTHSCSSETPTPQGPIPIHPGRYEARSKSRCFELQITSQILPCPDPSITEIYRLRAPPRRLQSILSTNAPLTLLVPSLTPSPELSAALRIAHALQLFHALDAQIVSIADVDKPDPSVLSGNLVVIGCADAPLIQHWLEDSIWRFTNKAWHMGMTRFDRPSSGTFLPSYARRDLTCVQRSCFASHTRTTAGAPRCLCRVRTRRDLSAPCGCSRSARACSRPIGSSWTVARTRSVLQACKVQGRWPARLLYFCSRSSLAYAAGNRPMRTSQPNGRGTNACHGSTSLIQIKCI